MDSQYRLAARSIINLSKMPGISESKPLLQLLFDRKMRMPLLISGDKGSGRSLLAYLYHARFACTNPNGLDVCGDSNCDCCADDMFDDEKCVELNGAELTVADSDDLFTRITYYMGNIENALVLIKDFDLADEYSTHYLIEKLTESWYRYYGNLILIATDISKIPDSVRQFCCHVPIKKGIFDELNYFVTKWCTYLKIPIESNEAAEQLIVKTNDNPTGLVNILGIIKLLGQTLSIKSIESPIIQHNLLRKGAKRGLIKLHNSDGYDDYLQS